MNIATVAALALAASLAAGAAMAQCPLVIRPNGQLTPDRACMRRAAMAYAPRAYAPNVYDEAQQAAYRERLSNYWRERREAQWSLVRAEWPRADYDAMYGPGAYYQNHELPKHPF